MSELVQCAEHVAPSEAFVCSHIAASLSDGKPRGFYYSSLNAADEPSAWCGACDEMLEAGGGAWTGELEEKAQIKLFCYECFLKAARLNGVLH